MSKKTAASWIKTFGKSWISKEDTHSHSNDNIYIYKGEEWWALGQNWGTSFKHTSMSFQHLYDFSCLQIPYISFIILAASHYPFPASNAKTSRYAIFWIGMTYIGFQTSCGLVIPKTDSTIVCGWENIFRIWRKLNVLTWEFAINTPKFIEWKNSELLYMLRTRWRYDPLLKFWDIVHHWCSKSGWKDEHERKKNIK